MSERRHTEQFEFAGPDEMSVDRLEAIVREELGDGIKTLHQSGRQVDVPVDEIDNGTSKRIDILVATIYLDEYYIEKTSPNEMVGDDAEDLRDVFEEYEVSVRGIVNSAF